ncbi:MAG: hypothetical protein JW986_02095 [Methanotrichaceae archaeon]|nr:hypothetical protein [Methanotrichaceae archaeon]
MKTMEAMEAVLDMNLRDRVGRKRGKMGQGSGVHGQYRVTGKGGSQPRPIGHDAS